MDLRKIVRGDYESLFYAATGEAINQKTCELLGYKSGVPVLNNIKIGANKPDTSPGMNIKGKPTLRVVVNAKTGEKFINLNGKNLKMIAESQLPSHLKQNAQVIKATPGTAGCDNKPVKIKIIGSMPSILHNPSRLVKNDPSQLTNDLKHSVNKTDNGSSNVLLSPKTMIRESKPTIVKIPSDCKVVARYSTAAGGSNFNGFVATRASANLKQQWNDRPVTNNPNLLKCDRVLKCVDGVLRMNPLDLSKVTKVDKGVQFSPDMVDQAVQSDKVQSEDEDPLLNFLNIELLDLLSSNTPAAEMRTSATMSSKEMNTVSNPVPQGMKYSENFRMFFHDLRSAMMPDVNGNMPIHVGVLTNNFSFVKRSCSILKALQTSVDILNHSELTALQLAILHDCDPQIVKTLLAHDASLEVVDSEGNNVIHLAIECKRTGLLDILLESSAERKFNLNDFNAEGLTPLMICCCNNLIQCADVLIKYYADINVRDRKSGRTALFHAAENHHLEMVQLLLNYNADTKIKNFFGTSPHDAMYEVEEIPDTIKSAILGKNSKRKSEQDPKSLKVRRIEENMHKLKTYSKLKKIEGYNFAGKVATMAK